MDSKGSGACRWMPMVLLGGLLALGGSCGEGGAPSQIAARALAIERGSWAKDGSLRVTRTVRVHSLLPPRQDYYIVFFSDRNGPHGEVKMSLSAELLGGAERGATPPLPPDEEIRQVVVESGRKVKGDVEWLLVNGAGFWVSELRPLAKVETEGGSVYVDFHKTMMELDPERGATAKARQEFLWLTTKDGRVWLRPLRRRIHEPA